MKVLTTELLSRACRLFLALAYPAGEATIPEKRRVYYDIPVDAALAEYLPPGACAQGIGQVLRCADGAQRGYTLRLGSAHFPHLKLQVTEHHRGSICVFSVDTHDALPLMVELPADHPDSQAWAVLRQQNQRLKEEIEQAWEQAGFWTFNRLLREELKREGAGIRTEGEGN